MGFRDLRKYTNDQVLFVLQERKKGKTWSQCARAFYQQYGRRQTANSIKKVFLRNKYKLTDPNKVKQMDEKDYKSILVISDMHIPYQHPDTFNFLKFLKKRFKFDKVVCIGDEVDYHAISFHDSNPDLPSAGDELSLSRKHVQTLSKIFPKMDIVESNHGSLVYRKALASGLPMAMFRNYNDILGAPSGWVWRFDFKIKTPLGKVYFCHGKSGIPGRLASQYGMSCVQGHYHEKSQISYISTPDKLMFDMHVGCLADDKSLALGYNKINPRRPIVSVGVIVNGIPQIIPMVLGSNGRWIGKF